MSSGNDNILIVDDNISIQDDFRKILNSSAQESDPKMNELEKQLFGETSSSESHFFNNKQINYRLSFSSQGNEAKEKVDELAVAQMQSVESAKFAALGIMSAGLAHELNTPLCAILIASEQVIEKLADDAETPKTKLVSKLLKQIVSM